MVGVSNAPGGMVDANRLLLLKDGVGLLTAGGGPSGGVGCRGIPQEVCSVAPVTHLHHAEEGSNSED